MKKYTLYMIAFLMLFLCGCSDASAKNVDARVSSEPEMSEEVSSKQSEYEYVFYGKVLETESDFGGILVESEDENIASPVVVHSEDIPELAVGDRIKVEYSGQIALSYPGQIFGARITLATE